GRHGLPDVLWVLRWSWGGSFFADQGFHTFTVFVAISQFRLFGFLGRRRDRKRFFRSIFFIDISRNAFFDTVAQRINFDDVAVILCGLGQLLALNRQQGTCKNRHNQQKNQRNTGKAIARLLFLLCGFCVLLGHYGALSSSSV